jgi:cytochrome c553
MRTQMFLGVLSVLSALAVQANASESSERILGARLQVCGTCHGANGAPKNATIPVIWGQQENYILKQLQDFQSGDRAHEVMAWMAKTIEPADLGTAAANFAKKNWPAPSAVAASTPAPNGIAVCQACHEQNFAGALRVEGMTTPRLAGQSYEYLVEAMRRFADGERTNNADMVEIMKAISPAQRDAMARYISGL